jgi:hypothetical protein
MAAQDVAREALLVAIAGEAQSAQLNKDDAEVKARILADLALAYHYAVGSGPQKADIVP